MKGFDQECVFNFWIEFSGVKRGKPLMAIAVGALRVSERKTVSPACEIQR